MKIGDSAHLPDFAIVSHDLAIVSPDLAIMSSDRVILAFPSAEMIPRRFTGDRLMTIHRPMKRPPFDVNHHRKRVHDASAKR